VKKLCGLLLAISLALALTVAASARPPQDDSDAPDSAAVDAPGVFTPAISPNLVTPAPAACSSGAHSLSHLGDRLYPEMGNGGYTSLHTDLYLNYDALANLFLAGTHADLQVKSTQCLSDLSFDFEQTNGHTADGTGPNMTVNTVEVNGQPATFRFVQPTYPGDPNGQNDPDPNAHAVSNANPVSATNPNPPACSPQVSNNSQNGTQCPANKLVVTPATPIPDGTTVTVTIDYTGRPGVHTDGDGSTEGWFRIATAGQEGSFVTTEPVGNDSWMPMNNFPTAKPTYDIYDKTNIGKTAIGPGELVGYSAPVGTTYQPVPPPTSNPPDANFPNGSVTWHWHSPEHIANYLVENSIGQYDLSARTSPTSGVQYWEAQANSITATKKATNKTAMDNQEAIVNFQTTFNGPWPLTTDGIVVGTPSASFEEEMQGKITFAGGSIGPTLGTFAHENMHQWFGDNVSEGAFNLTFWKEGFATLGEYLNTASGGSPPVITSGPAFETSLVNRFNTNYGTTSSSFWMTAPSNPTVGSLFNNSNTYTRPGTAYVALWEALTRDGMIAAMHEIQKTYGGGNITEPQLEQAFRNHLPVSSASCNQRLDQFFPQWFDTAYPSGGANTTNKPAITGPGLNGTGFVCAQVTPASPNGTNGWYDTAPSLTWSGYGAPAVTKTGCADGPVTAQGTSTLPCSVTTIAAPILTSGSVSESVNVDTVAPSTNVLLTPTAVGAWYSPRLVTLTATDATSGVASTQYRVDGGTWTSYTGPFMVTTFGPHTLDVSSTDKAGNVETGNTTTWGSDFTPAQQIAGLSAFVAGQSIDRNTKDQMQTDLDSAAKRVAKSQTSLACGQLVDFVTDIFDAVNAGNPKLTFAQATQLLSVNQIEVALGCIDAKSPVPAAENDSLGLIQAIAGMSLDGATFAGLDPRARRLAEDIADGSGYCSDASLLLDKIAHDLQHGDLTRVQAASLSAAVSAIAAEMGC
jgi:Peptidase family M1 domain